MCANPRRKNGVFSRNEEVGRSNQRPNGKQDDGMNKPEGRRRKNRWVPVRGRDIVVMAVGGNGVGERGEKVTRGSVW